MSQMEVQEVIREVEDQYDVDSCFAVEVGSRAWGFENENSDHDIRLVFNQDSHHYVFNNSLTSNINYETGDFEVVGWNLRDFQNMICSNDPSVIEALNAPIVHQEFSELYQLREYVQNHFNPLELWINYQTWCRKMYQDYLHDENRATVKKNLLAARCMMNAEYVINTHDYPNLVFEDLLYDIDYEPRLNIEDLHYLIHEKRNGNKNEDVGNIFGYEFESFIGQEVGEDINPQDHIRDYSEQIDDTIVIDHLVSLL